MGKWYLRSLADAWETCENFADEMAEQYRETGEVSDDLHNDYHNGDAYHHESHVDKAYSLLEAAELLEDLSDDEETDSGLWEGLDPREAVSAQAAYTYGNAVLSRWRDIVEDLNGHLASIPDAMPEDATGEQHKAAGEAFIAFYVMHGDPDTTEENREELAFCASALDHLKGGNATPLHALADYYQERGRVNAADQCRAIASRMTEALAAATEGNE